MQTQAVSQPQQQVVSPNGVQVITQQQPQVVVNGGMAVQQPATVIQVAGNGQQVVMPAQNPGCHIVGGQTVVSTQQLGAPPSMVIQHQMPATQVRTVVYSTSNIIRSRYSVMYSCEHCGHTGQTQLQYHVGGGTWLACVGAGFFGFCLCAWMPFILDGEFPRSCFPHDFCTRLSDELNAPSYTRSLSGFKRKECKDAIHTCANCKKVVGRANFLTN